MHYSTCMTKKACFCITMKRKLLSPGHRDEQEKRFFAKGVLAYEQKCRQPCATTRQQDGMTCDSSSPVAVRNASETVWYDTAEEDRNLYSTHAHQDTMSLS